MASLRDTFSFADPGVSQQGLEELQVQNMGTLRKGYEGGDIGTDANAAAAQLSALRANGQHAEADALQTELAALQQRRGLYAPEIGGVENIGKHGSIAGDAATWALENIGQGVASMQDPVLATTAMNAGGKLLGMSKNPIAQLASKALSWGAPAAAYGMNHEQLKGEFVQSAMRDPELMARTSWQDLNQTANVQALGGAALDTVLPAVLGRQLVGKAGMSALGKMAPTSFGGRTLAAMGFEGATEVGQTMGSQYALGHLNPNRITSDDFMENVNAGLGGMVGAGPLAAVGAAAEGGHQRLGGVADALGKKAGDTVDLATGAVDSAKEKGRSWWDRLTGGKEAEDLQGGEGAQALDPREIDVLLDKHLDPQTATDEDFLAADVERTGIVVKHLRGLAETNDRAAELLGRVMDPGAGDQVRALDESANFLKEHYNVEELDAEGNNLGRTLGKAAGAAGTAAVKGAARVVKNVVGGMVDGARSKKNLQADEARYTFDEWDQIKSGRHPTVKTSPEKAGSYNRAKKFGSDLVERMNLAARQAAEFTRAKHQGKEGLARMASHTAFELVDAADGLRRNDLGGAMTGGRNARLGRVADTMRRLYGAEDAMKMADTIASIVGAENPNSKYLNHAAEYVKAEIQRLETPAGRIQAKQERAELVSKIAATVSPQVHQKLLDNGVNLYGEHGEQFLKLIEKLADGTGQPEMRHKLNGMVGSGTVAKMLDAINESDIAKGKDEKRQKVSPMFGETADEQEILGEGFQVDDDGEVTDYEKRQGEKQVGKTSAPKLYGYKNTPVIRSSVDWRNPFAGAPVSKAALTKWRDSVESDKALGRTPKEDPRLAAASRRPSLFALDDKLTDERNAIEARIEAVKADLGEKSASWSVEAKKASDLLEDMKVPDAARISLYRDYLRKAVRLADEAEAAAKRKAPKAGAVKVTAEQKAKWNTEIEVLGRVLKDMYDERNEGRPDTKANVADEDGPDSSGIKSLGKERFEAARKRADEARQKYQELRKKYARAQEKHDANRAAQGMEDDVYGEDADESFYEVSDEDLGEFAGTAQAQMLINAGKAAKEAMAEYQELASAINAQNAPPPRTGTVSTFGERRTALRRADNYFANRYLVVAEDMTNRAPEDISLAEVRSMTNKGLKAMDFARKITSETDSRIEDAGLTGTEANQLRKAAKREHDEVVDAYNILEFAPLEGDKPVYIKAGDLVYWARTQRNKSEVMTKEKASKFGRGDLDREYLGDLMTGISTILASGAVGPQMPVKRNKFGKPEAFETPKSSKQNALAAVPDSLRLVTMTAGQMNYKPDERKGVFLGPGQPGADARTDEQYQERVAKDQQRREEPAVVDPLQDVGEMRTMDPQDYAALTPDERKTLNGFADRYAKAEGSTKTEIAREQREFLDGLSLRKDGKRYSSTQTFTAAGRERGMTDDAVRVNAENGTKLGVSGPKGGKTPAGETTRAVFSEDAKRADQIRRDRRMRNADGTKREVVEDGAEFPVEMTDDEISPLDFFPDQEPGAVPDEFADAQFRNRIEGYDPATTVSAEHKMSAAGQAKERGDALRGKLVPGRGEGRTELTAKQLEGINSIAARIRSAYRPERREKGDAGLVGGWHYLYPAAHALNTDFLSTLANGGKDPAGLVDTLEFLRGQLNRALLDSSATPKQKAAIAKLMAPKASAGRINEGNIQGILEKNAPARDESLAPTEQSSKTQAAPEVAAQEAPKAQAKPSGAGGVDLASRARHQGVKIVGTGDPTLAAASDTAAGRVLDEGVQAWRKGVTYKQFLASPEYLGAMHGLMVHKLMGTPGVQTAIDELNARAHQMFAIKYDKELEAAVMSRLSATDENTPAKLRDMMREILVADVDPATKVIARAVNSIAGDVDVFGTQMADIQGNSGVYNSLTKVIRVAEDADLGHAGTVLHEGVHAATVAAMMRDKGLHRAVYRLMDHVIEQNPRLRDAYGLTTSLEFLAEGLANISFQRELVKIKPNDAVARYLGKTVANAWDAFVGMVRTALNLDSKHESALAQLLDLGGRAMLATKANPSGLTHAEFETFIERGVAPEKRARELADAMVNSRQIEAADRPLLRQTLTDLVDGVVQDGLVPHKIVVAMATTLETFNLLPAGQTIELGSIFTALDANINSDASLVPSKAGRKLNAQDARTPRDTPASPEEIAKAKAWMNKVLPKVRVEFEKLTGYSGEFIEAENLVKISTTAAAGVMQTAYHEGLHAFFAGLAKNPEALRVVSSIADNRVIFRRLQALLAKYPAAQKQLVDGEERLAYAFQFWAAGKLQLPVGPAKGFFAKLRKFFRQVAGLVKDEEKAADIFQAFNDGKLGDPSTAGKVLNDILAQGTWTKKGLKRLDGLMQRVRQLIMPAEEILMRAPSAEAKALARQLFTNPGDEGSAGMREGLLNAQRTITTKEMNRFANAIAGLDDKDMANVAKLLEAKTPLNEIPYAPYLKAVKEIRQQLKDFHTYMQSSEMEMGTVKDDYFPRVWSLTKLIDDREGFVKMLMDNYPERLAEIAGAANLRNTKHGKLLDGAVEMDNKAAAEEITNYLIKRNGTDGKVATQREDGVLAPYFAAGEKREFAWIETQKSEPWQNKNLIGIMTGYLHEGVRSAEYTRRFGRKGEHLDASLRTIEAELTNHARAELAKGEFKDQKAANAWVTRQMRGIRQSVGAMEGSLGKDISDRMRKFNSWMMVYQNVRLLPLTLFASVVDPMGMIARGATMREAFEAFQRGIQEVFRGWADLFRQEPKGALSDKWTKLAEHIGAVDAAILSHHASEEYSSTYLSHGAKRINDAFFKINGMEAWNRGMRVGAVKSAAAFIARHKALPDVHSQRWLTELGLTPDQITLDGEGNLITDMQDLMDQTGVSKTEAKRQIDAIHAALNRWTLSAVLTPNAAQRPAWSSDPHYSLFFHLKQFSYSFHQTILKRAVKEMNYGNMGPIAVFAGYIPVMIASDVMKGLIVGGGTLPNHMQGMDLGDWVMHGLERSGTLGIGAIGVDASQDMFSVFGPGVEQLVDGITEPIADTTLRAMPLNPLVRAMAE